MPDMKELLLALLRGAEETCACEVCDACSYNGPTDCQLRLYADQLITNGVAVLRWIPVAERLPAEGQIVLARWEPCDDMVAYEVVMRQPGQDEFWRHVTRWIPIQDLQGE